jgi:hypothetical protein
MQPVDLKKYLYTLFESHQIPYQTSDEWILPYGRLPAIRATWFPKEKQGIFEVEVLLEDERIINECFSGFTSGEEGILNGLENFCINSFHVFLSAFWDKHCSDQVEIEQWSIGDKHYNVYIGNCITRATNAIQPNIPSALFETIEKSMRESNFEFNTSWSRVFFANVSGDFTFEALKENEIWEEGLSNLKPLPWHVTEGFYSVRNFLILKEIKNNSISSKINRIGKNMKYFLTKK